MKKILILALLFMGCSLFSNPEICAYKHSSTSHDLYECFNDMSEGICIEKNYDLMISYELNYHGDKYEDCSEYCESKAPYDDCDIDKY